MVDKLKIDENNARRHGEESLSALRESIRSYGVNRPVVVDEDGTVLAGNGVVQAARESGVDNVQVIEGSPDEIIAVRVRHLTDEEKRRYSIADNRTFEMSDWDEDALLTAIREDETLRSFWQEDELDIQFGDAWLSAEEVEVNEEYREREKARNEYSQNEKETLVCPYCYHEWKDEEHG